MRLVVFLFSLGFVLQAQSALSLADAVRQLSANVLAPGEVAHVTEHALAPEFAAETARARSLLESALRRPASRDARTVEVVVTATRNVAGPLLVLQFDRNGDQVVQTAAYTSQPPQKETRPSLVMRLLWRQADPMLDLSVSEDQMLVLGPQALVRFARKEGAWRVQESAALDGFGVVRDPRGRLLVSGDSVAAYSSAGACAGTDSPALQLACSGDSAEFQAGGEKVRFTSGENMLQTAAGDTVFSIARVGEFRLSSGADGTVRGSRGAQTFAIADWGSDIASLPAHCAMNPVLASGASLSGAALSEAAGDSLTAFEVTGTNPRRLTDPAPVEGVVTALWPAAEGVLAIVHEATGQYAAYTVSLDCGN